MDNEYNGNEFGYDKMTENQTTVNETTVNETQSETTINALPSETTEPAYAAVHSFEAAELIEAAEPIEATEPIPNVDPMSAVDLLPVAVENLGSESGGGKREEAPKRRPSNFGKAVAAFAIVTSVTGGAFALGLGAGIGITNAGFERTAAATAAIEEAVISSVAVADTGSTVQSMVLSPGETTVSAIYKKMSTAVVSINVRGTQTTFFNQNFETFGAGSGIVFKEDAANVYIVTNYHVVAGSNEVTISLDDDIQVEASPVGGSESDDIYVIAVKKADMIAAGITAYSIATFADSSTIEIGDVAVAIGNALGEGKSATLGIISAIDKQIDIENQILSVIQTDAAINPGNSGGALVNANGQVIGINTAKIDGGEGMGYAIPSNKVISIIDGIIGEGRVETPQLGIEGVPITEDIRAAYNLPSLGVYINNVVAGSSADEGGIRPGDIITGVNGKTITTFEELSGAIQAAKVGDKMTLTVLRDGTQAFTVEVTLKNREMTF